MAEHADTTTKLNSVASYIDDAAVEVGIMDGTEDPGSVSDAEAANEEAVSDGAAELDSGEKQGGNGWRRRLGRRRPTAVAAVLAVVVATIIALGGLAGWFEYKLHQQREAQAQRALFLQVGRQGALNLTTIDWQHADADMARILGSATGQFYDDFSKRSQPFVDVVKQAQSKSVGVITEAGVESASVNEAEVLVAVTVSTTNLGAPDQDPRRWRMRLTVQKVGAEAKVSNVVFVP